MCNIPVFWGSGSGVLGTASGRGSGSGRVLVFGVGCKDWCLRVCVVRLLRLGICFLFIPRGVARCYAATLRRVSVYVSGLIHILLFICIETSVPDRCSVLSLIVADSSVAACISAFILHICIVSHGGWLVGCCLYVALLLYAQPIHSVS